MTATANKLTASIEGESPAILGPTRCNGSVEMAHRLIRTLKRWYLHRRLRKEERNLKWLRGIPQDSQLYAAVQELIPLVENDIEKLQNEVEALQSSRAPVTPDTFDPAGRLC